LRRKVTPRRIAYRFRSLAAPSREFLDLRRNMRAIDDMTPAGDGRPVVFLPGFGAGDYTTAYMRRFMQKKGYNTYGWDNGVNLGPTQTTIDNVVKRLHEVYAQHGNKKITLIGHSLGGVLARELARDFPNMCCQVITLGSPIGIGRDKHAANPVVRKIFEMLHGERSLSKDEEIMEQMLIPPPVPTTSIYSRNDGVVNWKIALNPSYKKAENVEVDSSHIGLVVNKSSYLVVADRLGQPQGQWKPFDRSNYPEHFFYENEMHETYLPKYCKKTAARPHRPIFKNKP
jgi:hypothetical protein